MTNHGDHGRAVLEIAAALADANRLRIVACLRDGELCVCQINELLDIAPSTVSKHLSILRSAGLVESRKEGRWVHYRRPAAGESPLVGSLLRWFDRALSRDARVRADARRLRTILRMTPDALCGRQRGVPSTGVRRVATREVRA